LLSYQRFLMVVAEIDQNKLKQSTLC